MQSNSFVFQPDLMILFHQHPVIRIQTRKPLWKCSKTIFYRTTWTESSLYIILNLELLEHSFITATQRINRLVKNIFFNISKDVEIVLNFYISIFFLLQKITWLVYPDIELQELPSKSSTYENCFTGGDRSWNTGWAPFLHDISATTKSVQSCESNDPLIIQIIAS